MLLWAILRIMLDEDEVYEDVKLIKNRLSSFIQWFDIYGQVIQFNVNKEGQ